MKLQKLKKKKNTIDIWKKGSNSGKQLFFYISYNIINVENSREKYRNLSPR